MAWQHNKLRWHVFCLLLSPRDIWHSSRRDTSEAADRVKRRMPAIYVQVRNVDAMITMLSAFRLMHQDFMPVILHIHLATLQSKHSQLVFHNISQHAFSCDESRERLHHLPLKSSEEEKINKYIKQMQVELLLKRLVRVLHIKRVI